MKKAFEKHQIWFAVAAIIIYVMTAGNLRADFGEGSPVQMWGLLALAGILTLLLARGNLLHTYGLDFWPESRPYLYFLPFLVLGLLNLIGGVRLNYGAGQVYAVVSMALVGYLEEMTFRGLLYRAINRENHTRAVIISAVTFGAGHIANLLTGSAAPETFVQVGYAIAIGFVFVIAYDRCGSLWPVILTHSLIDVTSTFANNEFAENPVVSTVEVIVIIVVSVLYSVYLIRKFPKKDAAGQKQ